MELIFEIVSYHRLSPEQTSKKSITSSITLGRSENSGWHLPDPEKVVSGTHARIERQSNDFYIYDESTNGLYINRAIDALGKGKSHKLAEGDLLTFGDYEVSVSFDRSEPSDLEQSIENYAQPVSRANNSTTANEIHGFNSATLAEGVSSLAVDQNVDVPLISNDLNDHFEVPQAIPEEWDIGFLNTGANVQSNAESNTVPNQPTAPIYNDVQVLPEPEKPLAPQQAPKQDPIEPPAIPLHYTNEVASGKPANIIAFLDGLGVSPECLPEDFSDKLMYEMGKSMQLMLVGLMETLRNRSNLKNEFKINQTTFQQQENNPLKFSASIDDVFQNLFLRKSSSFLPVDKAIKEAFNDTRKHDIALTAGTLGAVEGILAQLDPIALQSKDIKNSFLDQIVPGKRKLRYWKMYQELHSDMSHDIVNQGSSALPDEFVKEYDKKLKTL